MKIQKDLDELINSGIISEETADKISDFYEIKSSTSGNRLFLVFGILGSLLVSLGIILIIAHNWDELSKSSKTAIAFAPLIIGQLAVAFSIFKSKESKTWKEGSSTFLYVSIGATISLISQIYNISGNMSTFILTWSLLGFPLIYLMRSSMASLLFIIGITWFSAESEYWNYPSARSYYYWGLILLALPHYYYINKIGPKSNFVKFHNWLLVISLVISLGTIGQKNEELMFISYFSLFTIFSLFSKKKFFLDQDHRFSVFQLIGNIGSMVILLSLSFDWFWERLTKEEYTFQKLLDAPETYSVLITASIVLFLILSNKSKKQALQSMLYIIFLITFIVGFLTPYVVVAINLLILAAGIYTIREGTKQDHLGILNYGLLIITALVICRFFDTDLSFVIRGILFVVVGIGFFFTNYWMLKKRKGNE